MNKSNQKIIPKKWHIYVVDLEPRIGSKPGKQRPCLCIQPTEFCEAGLASSILIPITSQIIDDDVFPIRVRIPKGTCTLEKPSDLLIDQMLAWDISYLKKDLGEIPLGLQEIVKTAIRDFLDI